MDVKIDVWKTLAVFFKSDPSYVILSIITVISFIITIFVYIKLRSFNFAIKKERKIEGYKQQYMELKRILNQKSIPSDIFTRFENLNTQLFWNIGFLKRNKIKKQFHSLKKDDTEFTGLKSFVNDIIITLERDIP
jgi:hypothetical protein